MRCINNSIIKCILSMISYSPPVLTLGAKAKLNSQQKLAKDKIENLNRNHKRSFTIHAPDCSIANFNIKIHSVNCAMCVAQKQRT